MPDGESLTWRIGVTDDGNDCVLIENLGDETGRYIDWFTIAKHGTTAGSISTPRRGAPLDLAPGTNVVLKTTFMRGTSVGDDVSFDDTSDFYVNGVRVPHA